MTAVRELALALKAQKYGRGFRARCPAHDDRHPSLDIVSGDDGTPLLRCRAGCSQEAVISALRMRGIWPPRGAVSSGAKPGSETSDHERRIADAGRIADAARPIGDGDPADLYFRSRGLSGPYLYPHCLLFIDGVRHPSGTHVPALVAVAYRADWAGPVAVQMTALSPTGLKADIRPLRWTLGVAKGAAVWLSPPGEYLILVEGVEDGLAIVQMTGEPVAALLGTTGFTNFLPPKPHGRVVLAPDNDDAGRRVLEPAGTRMLEFGLEVRTKLPPAGLDWADLLELFAERAAILEYEGGLERHEAEKRAWLELMGVGDG